MNLIAANNDDDDNDDYDDDDEQWTVDTNDEKCTCKKLFNLPSTIQHTL